MNDAEIEQQTDTANTVLGCDELGEYYANDDLLNDPVNRQIFEEDTDRRLAQRDIAGKSLMDAAAAMRSPRPNSAAASCTPALTTPTWAPPGSSSQTRPPAPSPRPSWADRRSFPIRTA